jgi:hydroxymethylglutaryl-CoA reductase
MIMPEEKKTSAIQGFHSLTPKEKLEIVRRFALLDDAEVEMLSKAGGLEMETANRMIENVIGEMNLPLGIATNFLINGKDYLIPMALEEPSVVAGASKAAKLARVAGGFKASSTDPIMIGQIQVVGIKDCEKAKQSIEQLKDELMHMLDNTDPILAKYGGGPRDLRARVLETEGGDMLIVHLHVDVRDAMGANAVNTMLESIAPRIVEITGGRAVLRIISNLATERMARSEAVWKKDVLGGEDAVNAVLQAYYFADHDHYRCTTHNKGIMNGIDAVTIATGNDFRAVEAGAHSYAAITGRYKPLTKYWKDAKGDLHGSIELPLAVATIGGATKTNPLARICLKILGVKSSQELAQVIASVGLAQNFAALYALSTTGIQAGHMKLHAFNLAVMAGAKGSDVDRVAQKMIDEGNISATRAKEIMESR